MANLYHAVMLFAPCVDVEERRLKITVKVIKFVMLGEHKVRISLLTSLWLPLVFFGLCEC